MEDFAEIGLEWAWEFVRGVLGSIHQSTKVIGLVRIRGIKLYVWNGLIVNMPHLILFSERVSGDEAPLFRSILHLQMSERSRAIFEYLDSLLGK